MAAIDQQLAQFQVQHEAHAAAAAVGVTGGDGISQAVVSTSPSRSVVDSEASGPSRHSRVAVGAEAEANRRAADFLQEQREERAAKAKSDSLDAQLRKLRTEAMPTVRSSPLFGQACFKLSGQSVFSGSHRPHKG